MKYPTKEKLSPLGSKFAAEAGYTVTSSGKVSNGKRGLKRCEWKSTYDLALCQFKAGMIIKARINGKIEYKFKSEFGLMPYPYIRGLDLTHRLEDL